MRRPRFASAVMVADLTRREQALGVGRARHGAGVTDLPDELGAIGLTCLYPNAGDIPMSNGCHSAAGLQCISDEAGTGACTWCIGDAGQWTCGPTLDAGADVQIGHWVGTQ